MKRKRFFHPGGYFNRLFIYLPVFALLSGGIIYILLRPSEHVFFKWIRIAGFDHWLSVARDNPFFPSLYLQGWIVYSLPNGLWSFAYALLITGIWAGSKSWLRYGWMVSIPALVLGYEMFQYLQSIPGTFCIQDIVLGTAGLTLGIITGIKTNKSNHHEKAFE